MYAWLRRRSNPHYGLVIDIGSGSVLVSIVESDPNQLIPSIIWAKREYVQLTDNPDLARTAKAVMSSLMSALMAIDTEARTSLQKFNPGAYLHTMQVTVSAPWSYTISKKISYQTEDSFTITKNLVASLLEAAENKVINELKENETASHLNLSIVDRTALSLIANGYRIEQAAKQVAKKLDLMFTSTILQDHLATTITDAHHRVAPRTMLEQTSFMVAYFQVMRELRPHWLEMCLVDLTFEATEIGIVRNGVLQYCTHTPFGLQSLARELSVITGLPLADALGRLTLASTQELIAELPVSKQREVTQLFDSYGTALVEIFKETGDAFEIPQTIILHTDSRYESCLQTIITRAAKEATQFDHYITPITSVLETHLNDHTKGNKQPLLTDSAMLVSALFFHITQTKASHSESIGDIL